MCRVEGELVSLDREQVLITARRILDEYGLADLSMRRVAQALDVQAGALYYHVANKQALLAGVADLILTEVAAPPEAPWREAMSRWALGFRQVLLEHRDSAEVIATSRALDLVKVDVTSGPTAVLTATGLDPGAAAASVEALLAYALGHIAGEQARQESVRLNVATTPAHAPDFGWGVRLWLDGVAACRP